MLWVLIKSKIIIGENDSTEIIFKQIISKGKPLLLQTLNVVIDGKFKLEEQNEKNVTYANKIKKNESKIDWNKSAKEVLLKIRAFYPTPGAWTYLDNGKRVRVLIARVLPKSLEYNKKDQNFGLVEDDLIILALKGADEELKTKLFGCMSQRAAANIQDEMEALGPVRLTEVQEAQKQIIAVARRMSDEGSIVLAGRGGDDYV